MTEPQRRYYLMMKRIGKKKPRKLIPRPNVRKC